MKKIRFLLALFWIVFGLFPSAVAAQPVRDFYRDLGIMPGTSSDELKDDELKEAYQRAIERLLSGPGQSLEAQERLTELQKSYDILRDPKLRAEYDKSLKEAGFQKEPNYYKILGVLSDSSPAQIRRAYRQIRQKVHPDKQRDRSLMAMATRRFQELKEAYEVLSDPMRRLMHDHQLKRFSGNTLPHFKPAERGVSPGKGEEMDAGRETPSGKRAGGPLEEGINLSRITAQAMSDEEGEDYYGLYWWNKEIFQLARELEKSGKKEDIKEAVEWYRTLAVEGHVEAARRLAPLLENIDMEEALYRYDQGSMDDSEGHFSRVAAFRQAQIYLKGVYEGNEAVIPKDEERASLLFERAFKLGVSREAIAREYDKNRNYEKAMEWRLKEKNGEQISGGTHLQNGEQISEGTHIKQNAGTAPTRRQLSDTPVHQAILANYRTAFGDGIREGDKAIVRMLKTFKKNGEIDWDAYNSEGRTALSLAAERFYGKVVRFLIEEAGADPRIPDVSGLFPIHQALLAPINYSGADGHVHASRLREILHLFDQTWTSRVVRVNSVEASLETGLLERQYDPEDLVNASIKGGETPLEIALRQGLTQQGNYNFIISGEYLWFANEVIHREGVPYLTDEELDDVIGLAAKRGAEKIVNLLMSKKQERYSQREPPPAGEPRANQRKGVPIEEKLPSRNWLSHFFGSFFANNNNCRGTFSSAKEAGSDNPSPVAGSNRD